MTHKKKKNLTYYFIDVDLKSRQLIGWDSETKDKVEVHSLKARMQTAAAAVLPDKAKAAMHAAYTKPKDD